MKDYKNIWFTSDHHFGHRNIIGYTGRPFEDLHLMNMAMTKRWNETVGKDDLVYYLGDFVFGKPNQVNHLAELLNGDKILLRGNHDRGPERFLNAGFLEVHDKITLNIAGYHVILCHYPYFSKEEPHLKFANKRPLDKGAWLIHGHIHEKWKVRADKRMINVSVEPWDFYPVHMETIIDIIKNNA